MQEERQAEGCAAESVGDNAALSKIGEREINLFNGVPRTKQTSDADATRDLLRKLPEKVVCNARVVAVRSTLRSKFLGDGREVIKTREQVELVSTGVLRAMQAFAKDSDELGSAAGTKATQEQVTSIRVKLNGRGENGRILLLKMLFGDTLDSVRKYINNHLLERTGASLRDHEYELRTSFPARVLKDSNSTLKELDLVPNGNIILRFLK